MRRARRNAIVSETTEAVRSLTRGFNELGMRLFGLLPGEDHACLSPVSIGASLAALLPAARSETAAALVAALGKPAAGPALASMVGDLDRIGGPRSELARLTLAMGLFVEEAYPLRAEYRVRLRGDFGADVFSVAFGDAEAAARQINGWVRDRTDGRIPSLVTAATLSPRTRLVLACAIHMRARWLQEFDPDQTRDRPFERLDGTRVDVPTMRCVGRYAYRSDAELGVEAVRIPYLGGLALVVLLPNHGRFREVGRALRAESIARIVDGMLEHRVRVELPRLRARFRTGLTDLLRQLGLESLFDPERADLGGLTTASELLGLSDVVHEAWIDIDEAGTEAAAATTVEVAVIGIPAVEAPPTVPFVVDRPFFFFIFDQRTQAILFLGRVLDPSLTPP